MSNCQPSIGLPTSPPPPPPPPPVESGSAYSGHSHQQHQHRHTGSSGSHQNYSQQPQQQQYVSPVTRHASAAAATAPSGAVIAQYHQHSQSQLQGQAAAAAIASHIMPSYSNQIGQNATHHNHSHSHNHNHYPLQQQPQPNSHLQPLASLNHSSIKAQYSNSNNNNSSSIANNRTSFDSSGQTATLYLVPQTTTTTLTTNTTKNPNIAVCLADNSSQLVLSPNSPISANIPSPVTQRSSSHSQQQHPSAMGNSPLSAQQIEAVLSLTPEPILLEHDELDQGVDREQDNQYQHLPMQQLSFSGSTTTGTLGRPLVGQHYAESELNHHSSSNLPPLSSPLAIHSSLAAAMQPEQPGPIISTVPGPNLMKVRRYKLFPGKNRFFCKGRIIMAKQISVFYFTLTLLCCTCTLFFVFDCPYLATTVSPIIPAVAVALFFFVLFALLRTSFTDPGIIPRATPEEAADVERQILPNQSNSPTYRPPPRTKEVIINDQPIKLKYCFTCKIFRPPRASHCSLCDNCVERFDHHCPWVGNCVGKRNYRFFYMFIVSLAFLCIYVFSCIITHLILLSKNSTLFDAIKLSPVSVIEGAICFFSVWSILGLAGFHTYLIMSNLTTNEDIKGSFSSKRNNSVSNPFSMGSAMRNCWSVLCSPWSPSLINARVEVYTDQSSLAAVREARSSGNSALNASKLPRPNLSVGGYPIQPQPFYMGGGSSSYVAGSISATTPLPSYAHYAPQHYKLPTYTTDHSIGSGAVSSSGDSSRHRHHSSSQQHYYQQQQPTSSLGTATTELDECPSRRHHHQSSSSSEYNQYAVSGPASYHRYHSTPGTGRRLTGSLAEQGTLSHNYSSGSNNPNSSNHFYGSLKKPLAQQAQQPNSGTIGAVSSSRSHHQHNHNHQLEQQQPQFPVSSNDYQQSQQQQYTSLLHAAGTSTGSSSTSSTSAAPTSANRLLNPSGTTTNSSLLGPQASQQQQPGSSSFSSSSGSSCVQHQHNHPQPPVSQTGSNHRSNTNQSGQSRVHPDYHSAHHQSHYAHHNHQGFN